MSSTDGLFETFAQIAQTDNARIIAQANERDLLAALKGILRRYDEEDPGAAFEPDMGCIECTLGTTPNDRNTGLCPRHWAERIIAKVERSRS